MDTEQGFQLGHSLGLDALDKINEELGDDNIEALKDALAGLMTAGMHCAYAFAPTEEIAEELISTCQQFALKNWEDENDL